MIYGLDSAYPPTLARLKQFHAKGWGFYGGYIGGRALHVWSKQDFFNVAAAGLRLIDYWVSPSADTSYEDGVAQGNACLVAMQQRGLVGWVWLDVESGAVLREFGRGFVDALHAGSCQVGLYGSPDTLKGMGDLFDSWYLAFYPTPMVTEGEAPPDFDHWQYSDGPSQDYSVARDDAPFAGIS